MWLGPDALDLVPYTNNFCAIRTMASNEAGFALVDTADDEHPVYAVSVLQHTRGARTMASNEAGFALVDTADDAYSIHGVLVVGWRPALKLQLDLGACICIHLSVHTLRLLGISYICYPPTMCVCVCV